MKNEIIGIREAAKRLNVNTTVVYRRMKARGIKSRVRYIKTVGLSTADLKKLIK